MTARNEKKQQRIRKSNTGCYREQNKAEVKSYVQDIALVIMKCREQAKSREHFIELMNANGYGVVWMDNRKYITFTNLA